MTTALITGMGSTTSISVAKGLRRVKDAAIRIIGTDTNRAEEIAGSTFCDAFYQVPRADNAGYIPMLLDICRRENVRVLFPIIDAELPVVAAHKTDFARLGVTAWVSEPATIQICNDKYATYQFFVEHGFPTPVTWTYQEASAAASVLAYPLIVKPSGGVSSIDVFKVENADELASALRRARNPVVQEYLEGPEYTIDALCDAGSTVLAAVPRERIETKAGISTKGRTVDDTRLIELASQIAAALKIQGPCNIQCRVTSDGPKFFEVNPRFSGTLPLTIEAGVNSPWILTQIALNGSPSQPYYDFEADVRMARYWEEVFYHAR